MAQETANGSEAVGGGGLKSAAVALERGEFAVGAVSRSSSFLVGTVVVCETRDLDYRFWGIAKPTAVNRYGTATLRAALALVTKAGVAPKILALPAGTFWCPFPVKAAEDRAAAHIEKIVSTLRPEIHQAKKRGLRSIVVGVDAVKNGCQVPVHIDLTGANVRVIGLARRSDGEEPEKYAPEAHEGSRSLVLDGTKVYVAYCGEINRTYRKGQVQHRTLGAYDKHDAIVDLAHYFRWPSAPRGNAKQNKSGLGYFLRGCANAAAPDRLRAPVFVSVALVGRVPYTSPSDGTAPSYWLAVNSQPRKDQVAGPPYRKPDATLVLRSSSQNKLDEVRPLLTVNLFA
jgi:hypothetical protein